MSLRYNPLFFFKMVVLLIFVVNFHPVSHGQEQAAAPTGDASTEEADGASSTEQAEAIVIERLRVIGGVEQARRTPGSAHYLSKDVLEEQQQDDINRILRQVPGVNIQEEDGYGLRPNIGMRGTGVERSQKITLMEDGILVAPAPYTAPSAYYFPSAGRMEGIEVLKGPATVSTGPYTNGGSLNLLSTAIPGDFGGTVNLSGGSHETRKMLAHVGDSGERFGWLVETYQFNTDGFKELDGGGKSGTFLNDYLAKLRFNSGAGTVYHSFELKLGKTKQFGHETYLGLTAADFAANPYRRYAASVEDTMDTDHESIQGRYYVRFSDAFDITTSVYANDFFRNWHKAERTRGTSNSAILADPVTYAQEVSILRGEQDSAPGEISIRNNRRNYESRGLQTVLHWSLAGAQTNHQLELGLRYHEDEEDRFQNDEFYQMSSGRLVLTESGAPGSQTNRVSDAEALAGFLRDEIQYRNWTFTPGLRFEQIDYTRRDFSRTDPTRSQAPSLRTNSVDILLPGIGIDYVISDRDRIFFGVNKGFSPPGAGANEDTRSEKSTNYELGWRRSHDNYHFEAIGFFNNYENLLGTETIAGGGTGVGDLFNGGQVEVSGLEMSAGLEIQAGLGWTVPIRLNYTYTTTEFQTSFQTSFADWGPTVSAGDALPYVPENQFDVNVGLVRKDWSFYLDANYAGEMRTKAGSGPIPENEGTDSRLVVDFSGYYRLGSRLKLFTSVRNAFDETYIVSRRPYGLRPGLERTFLVGIKAGF